MSEVRRFSLVKPTVQTRFHIDFDWWRKNDRDWRVYLRSNLCPEHQEAFANVDIDEQVDWVDPDSAEVQRVDGLQHVLITHCAKQPGFISSHSTLVDATFRIFLANGNTPLNALELSDRLGRPANTILRTFTGARVYKGVRPCLD
ncbi:MAG TPA: hypothetical protein VJL34_09240 [Anaerolineales bacterium]|nr:hypothetical protein [Anaerolineales bacterium]